MKELWILGQETCFPRVLGIQRAICCILVRGPTLSDHSESDSLISILMNQVPIGGTALFLKEVSTMVLLGLPTDLILEVTDTVG